MKPFEALKSVNSLARENKPLLDFALDIVTPKAQCIYCGRTYINPIEIDHLKHNIKCLQCEDIEMEKNVSTR